MPAHAFDPRRIFQHGKLSMLQANALHPEGLWQAGVGLLSGSSEASQRPNRDNNCMR